MTTLNDTLKKFETEIMRLYGELPTKAQIILFYSKEMANEHVYLSDGQVQSYMTLAMNLFLEEGGIKSKDILPLVTWLNTCHP